MPWSAPESGAPGSPSDPFEITSGPGGGSCAPVGFTPAFTAGTVRNKAGAFSALSSTMSGEDGEQDIRGLEVTLGPGVVWELGGISLCGDVEAGGGCPGGQ